MRGKLESDITLKDFLEQFGEVVDTFEGTIYSVKHSFHLIGNHLEMMNPEDVKEWKDKIDRLWYSKMKKLEDKIWENEKPKYMKNQEIVEGILNSYAKQRGHDNWTELIGYCNNEPEEITAHYEMAMDKYISEQKSELDKTENKIQIGKWYKDPSSEYLVCVTSILGKHNYVEVYGFGSNGNWFNKWDTVVHQLCVEATPQEVAKALIKNAKKRGLVNGVYITSPWIDGKISKFTIGSDYNLYYNELMVSSDTCSYTIFKDGQWAVVVDKLQYIKEAHRNGAKIQFKDNKGYWRDIDHPEPTWSREESRIKPEEKKGDGRFIKGQWYTHAEPGQEKFLIRVEDPEKQICSGWDCKGNPFKNEWVHLGNRLKKADWVGVSKTVMGHLCMMHDTENTFIALNSIIDKKIK